MITGSLQYWQARLNISLTCKQGTGILGRPTVRALLDAGFDVTVLGRGANPDLPSSAKYVQVDYSSLDSLVSALQGQDAVVSVIGYFQNKDQDVLVEAAFQPGSTIKRFIPSEYGSDSMNPKVAALPSFTDKTAIFDKIKDKIASTNSNITYTIIACGPFLDLCLQRGVLLGPNANKKDKKVVFHDDGNRPFSTTTLATTAKAIVGVLKNPEATANRAVYVHDVAITQRQLLGVFKKAAGDSEGWTEEHIAIEDLVAKGWAELKKEKPEPFVWAMAFISASIWGEGYGGHFEKNDNELFGIKEMGEEELVEFVKKYV